MGRDTTEPAPEGPIYFKKKRCFFILQTAEEHEQLWLRAGRAPPAATATAAAAGEGWGLLSSAARFRSPAKAVSAAAAAPIRAAVALGPEVGPLVKWGAARR